MWWMSAGGLLQHLTTKIAQGPKGKPGVPGQGVAGQAQVQVQVQAPGAGPQQRIPPHVLAQLQQQQAQVQPRAGQPMGPPAPRAGTPCQFDAHMDERTERAVVKALEKGDPTLLRGFADSVSTKLPREHFPMGYFPVAAFVMRAAADAIEKQRAMAPAPASPVVAAPAPAPAASHVNGVAKPVADEPAPTPEVHPEG